MEVEAVRAVAALPVGLPRVRAEAARDGVGNEVARVDEAALDALAVRDALDLPFMR